MKWIIPGFCFVLFLFSIDRATAEVVDFVGMPKAQSSTVSGLPSCTAALQGTLFIATDALTPVALSTVTGGGAVKVLVFCNGANWIVG